jgi:hypothetical protein
MVNFASARENGHQKREGEGKRVEKKRKRKRRRRDDKRKKEVVYPY